VKWGPVVYTFLMFTFATVFTAMNLNIQSVSYIDNREYAGDDDKIPPGPLGYQYFIYSKALSIVPNLMFLLNNWLADGLLLYRCYVIYSMNPLAIAFPSMMYLTSVAMGILFIYQTSQPDSSIWTSVAISFGIPYFSISLSLNVILTLLIVTRLVLHNRNIRVAMGVPPGFTGLYKAIVTMLIESSALYAVSSLLFVGPWGAGSHVADIFLPILAETQVIAPLLIIRRVADQSALTSNSVATGHPGSFNFKSQGRITSGSGTLRGYPMHPSDLSAKSSHEHGNEADASIHFNQDV